MTHEINDRGPGQIGVRGCLRAILVVTFLLAACAAPTPSVAPPTPSPPPAPTATPRPTEPLATVELNPLLQSLEALRQVSSFPGVVLIPQAPGPFPAVVVLHGSEGGTNFTQPIANELAHAGYVALALCYFDCPDTPSTVHNINVEVVMDAANYLKARSDVRPGAVGLVGYSLGAELALIVGALDPNVRAVVSVMGLPWVTPGRPQVGRGEAWLYQGKSLPFTAIPVEQINGPVLLLHGEQDTVTPVAFAYLFADRLEAHNRAYELAVYSARGHDIGLQPPDALKRIIYFLDRTLP